MPEGKACIFGATGGIGSALCEALADSRPDWTIFAGGREEPEVTAANIEPFRFDLEDEASLAAAARSIGSGRDIDLVIIATGILQTEQFGPEKTWSAIDPAKMAKVFAVNTIGPALIAKHFLPLLKRQDRAVFAAISARVGSISDNRLGGWHSYRASKAALTMLVRNFAIDLKRKNPAALAVALHPGTVDTPLSAAFQANVPEGKLFTARYSAHRLLEVIDGLAPEDNGGHFAWDGEAIPA